MSVASPRYVPWPSWEEWDSVKTIILSDDNPNKVEALEIIGLWRSRAKIPHAIDSTAQLLEVIAVDALSTPSAYIAATTRSSLELRNLYAISIVRAVNGLVDPSQQGLYAESVLALAARLGIPSSIVEIRHDSTHNSLPNLKSLRLAANQLVRWYFNFYWIRQQGYIQELSLICLPEPFEPSTMNECKSFTDYRNSSSTSASFLADIYLPMFLQSAIETPGHACYTSDFRILQEGIATLINAKKLWWEQILEIFLVFPHFFNTILTRLINIAIEEQSMSSKHHSTSNTSNTRNKRRWRLLSVLFWMEQLLASDFGLHFHKRCSLIKTMQTLNINKKSSCTSSLSFSDALIDMSLRMTSSSIACLDTNEHTVAGRPMHVHMETLISQIANLVNRYYSPPLISEGGGDMASTDSNDVNNDVNSYEYDCNKTRHEANHSTFAFLVQEVDKTVSNNNTNSEVVDANVNVENVIYYDKYRVMNVPTKKKRKGKGKGKGKKNEISSPSLGPDPALDPVGEEEDEEEDILTLSVDQEVAEDLNGAEEDCDDDPIDCVDLIEEISPVVCGKRVSFAVEGDVTAVSAPLKRRKELDKVPTGKGGNAEANAKGGLGQRQGQGNNNSRCIWKKVDSFPVCPLGLLSPNHFVCDLENIQEII